jgi:hypothetical protein
MRKHKVTFLSPDTFVSEQTTRTIDEWDTAKAAKMAASIEERYGAKPFGFYFTTDLVGADVPDGEGGTLKTQPKEVARSSTYFLGGELLTYEDIVARNKVDEKILRSNMLGNDYPVVIQNTNSWKVTLPFEPKDALLDGAGNVVVQGDEPEWMEHRRVFAANKKKGEGIYA